MIYVKDLEGRYLLVNRHFSELFHLAAGDVLGKTDHDLFPADIADAFAAMDRRVVTEGAPLTEEEVAPLDDGVRTYLSVKCSARGRRGQAYAVFGISTDITDRKRMEQALIESRQHYQALAESLPHLVWTCRPMATAISSAANGWSTPAGPPRSSWASAGPSSCIPTIARACGRSGRTPPQRGDTYDEEFRIRRADGDVSLVQDARACRCATPRARVVKWFGSNTDFEDYKQSEQRLRAQLERLDLLDRLTRAIGERQDLHSILQVVVTQPRGSPAARFLLRVPATTAPTNRSTVARVGVKSEPLARKLALPEQARIRARPATGLSRCVRGQLVHEPDIARAQSPFAQRLAPRRAALASWRRRLLVESQVFGVLIAARHEPSGFSSADCEFLRQLSEHVALAAHQAQLYTALQQAYDDLRQTQQAVDAAGAAEGARADGERDRPRHQQRHLTRGALHRVAARDRATAERPARGTISRPSSAPSRTWRRRWRGCASSTASASRRAAVLRR